MDVGNRLGDLFEQDARDGRCLERNLAGEHLVRDDAERVDVAARVDLALARRLLGAHVCRRPDRDTRAGQCAAAGVRQRLGDSEIGDHHSPPGPLEEDVVGLDVPMHDPHRMREPQRVGRFLHDASGFFDGEPLPASEPGGERLAVDIAHHEVDEACLLADGVDRHDVRMRQPGGGLCFPSEPLPDFLAEGEFGWEHLDSDATTKSYVACAEHDAHAAPTDLTLDRVGIGQHFGESTTKRLLGLVSHVALGPDRG